MNSEWTFQHDFRSQPIIATAIHAGHIMRYNLHPYLNISPPDRMREEDPFTDLFTQFFSNKIIVNQSRFEFDLNRPRDKAIYQTAEDAWGLTVWNSPLPEGMVNYSLDYYDRFYSDLRDYLDKFKKRYKFFILLDIHSYNFRRNGRHALPMAPYTNPDINLGTESISPKWRPLLSKFIDYLQHQTVGSRFIDARENIKFKGGYFPRWINQNYGECCCAIALEYKKIFMNEWTNTVNTKMLDNLMTSLGESQKLLLNELEKIKNSEEKS